MDRDGLALKTDEDVEYLLRKQDLPRRIVEQQCRRFPLATFISARRPQLRILGLREIVWVKSSVFGHPRCHGPLPARPPDPRRDLVREASCTRPRHFAVCGAVWIEAACVNRNQTGCQISGSMQVRTLSRKYSSSRIPYDRRWITRILLFSPSTKPSGTLFSGLQ